MVIAVFNDPIIWVVALTIESETAIHEENYSNV